MQHNINAENQILGRLASRVAFLLRGKDTPAFDPARLPDARVTVYNTDKMRVSGKKLVQKLYRRHSGYHGGLKEERLADVLERDSRLALRRAVMGMLPKNRLRPRMIKKLTLVRGEKQ